MNTSGIIECELHTIQQRPEFPEYAMEIARLESFEEWPKQMKQKPDQLADAGFFYTHKGDRVICFSCGGGLRQWNIEDDPWQEHALHYKECNYLQLIKGSEYITMILEKYGKNANGKEGDNENSLSSLQQKETDNNGSSNSCSNDSLSTLTNKLKEINLNDTRSCKICFINEYNTVFLPCGHIVACAKCASSQNKCPICRKPFKQLKRIYLP